MALLAAAATRTTSAAFRPSAGLCTPRPQSAPAPRLRTARHAAKAAPGSGSSLSGPIATSPFDDVAFAPIRESEVSRAMSRRYFDDLDKYAQSDVVIVGAGCAGLSCAWELSRIAPALKVALIEQSVSPGGGAWLGGQLFSAMVVRKPGHALLDALGVGYEDEGAYVVVKHAALATSTLLAQVLKAPNVKLFNAVCAEDLIVKPDEDARGGKRVAGVVTNWTLVAQAHGTQSCMDPNVMEAGVVVSACGHDGPFGATCVKRLAALGMVPALPGMAALDMAAAEDGIVRSTREAVAGLVLAGMELAELDGTPRMGPTFGAMLVSGRRAAHVALAALERRQRTAMPAAPAAAESSKVPAVGASA